MAHSLGSDDELFRGADPERDLYRAAAAGVADHSSGLGGRGGGAAGCRRVRLHRRRCGGRVDDARESRRVRKVAHSTADARRQRRPRHLGRRARPAFAGPFLLAPIGVLSIAHESAEVAVGEAAASSGVPMLLSSAATHSIEDVAATDAPRWFQLYWVNDREICASFVRRAEAAGYGAIVVTLDTLTLGWRPRDLRQAYLPFIRGEGCGQFFSDPVFLSRLESRRRRTCSPPRRRCSRRFRTSGSRGRTSTGCRQQTKLPLLVKGVLTADDARPGARARHRRRRSSRTTAGARSTVRSRRSMHSSRCATRCPKRSC